MIFFESLNAVRKNIVIITPTIIASIIVLIATSIIIGSDLATIDETNLEKTILVVAPRLFMISALNYFLQALSHCVTIAMAIEIENNRMCNVFDSSLTVLKRIGRILPASILILIFLTAGLMLLILPALYVCFAFMLTFIIIMNEDITPAMAMMKSYRAMKDNYSRSIVLFFFLSSLWITVSIINLLLGQLHYFGVISSLFLSGLFMAFATITLLKFYRILEPNNIPLSSND
ncbi:hypothetical protein ASN18_2548 [Candidatus Magnetominusculus xianensis]|uniref:Uncharacterized protein n=2 Tax=Candidatus Magnetominusculus xianensis TaxID=1748249 RepID=A0ABR5SCS2_9BACT|nr:hypothetical protein ASN18_2548 [Candidatus Magnetominusculus xianensis]